MKLTEKTLKLLKNFASINQSIYVQAGNEISTVSIAKNIFGEATVEEDFPVSFAIYDLIEFLNTLKLFNAPILDFSQHEKYMVIGEENDPNFSVRYVYAPLDHIVYPKQKPNMNVTEINFTLSNDILNSILKASNVMQLPNMVLTPANDENHVKVNVTDVKDNSSNKFSIEIEANNQAKNDFSLIFNMDTFKMIPQEYNIGISGGRLSAWMSDDVDYVIAMDINSTFEG